MNMIDGLAKCNYRYVIILGLYTLYSEIKDPINDNYQKGN